MTYKKLKTVYMLLNTKIKTNFLMVLKIKNNLHFWKTLYLILTLKILLGNFLKTKIEIIAYYLFNTLIVINTNLNLKVYLQLIKDLIIT